tara:strand:- start:635 stop:856 length:222 start_codon:yes stop_codon:yes gene_type:complete
MRLSERLNKLSEARRLSLEVRDSLSPQTHTCSECGLERHENWDHKQVRDVLNAVINRLEKTLERMEDNPDIFG